MSSMLRWVVIGGAVIAGCSSDDPDPVVEERAELLVETTPITLAPGEERYVCWDLDVPPGETFAVGGVDMELPPGIHHYQLTVIGPGAGTPGVAYDCGFGEGGGGMGPPGGDMGPPPGGDDMGGPPGGMLSVLSVGGPTTPGVEFPAEAAMMLEPGTRIQMQLHLLNASGTPFDYDVVKAHVFEHAGDPATLQPVGVILVNDDTLQLPPRTSDVRAGTQCAPGVELESVFMVWPHMHLLGREIGVDIGGRSVVDVDAWNFDDQALFPMTERLDASGAIDLRCTYDNPTERNVTFGMGTNDEMCTAFVYYYPAVAGVPGMCGERAETEGD